MILMLEFQQQKKLSQDAVKILNLKLIINTRIYAREQNIICKD